MKILLMGSPNSIYIKQYIKNVLAPLGMDIYLVCNGSLDSQEKAYYDNYNVKLVNIYEKRGLLKQIPFVGTIISFIKNLKALAKNERFDVIHIHYVGNIRLMKYVYNSIRKATSKLVLTFWGSDLFGLDNKTSRNLEGLLKVSDLIVVPTESMKLKFKELYGCEFNDKIRTCLFGNPIVDKYLELKQNSLEAPKCSFDIPKDKYVISVGYNGAERHQHDKILNEICKLPLGIRENIFIVLQMGYGATNAEYLTRLKRMLKENQLSYLVIDRYIDELETIALKKEVDLFIHGQISDALSSSVLEYMFFYTEVLNPSWIKYTEWKNLGIKYHEYNEFTDLCKHVLELYNHKKTVNHDKNAEIIEHNFSWASHANDWKALYL